MKGRAVGARPEGIEGIDEALGQIRPAYSTTRGTMYQGTIEDLLSSEVGAGLEGQVQMIFTSPPFPLTRRKTYGNKSGEAYLNWLSNLAPRLVKLLKPDGSIVMEIGNAWEPGKPTMSTLALRALLSFLDAGGLNLCQQFVCHNPARLPSPAQWVNVERIRVKDSFTHVWWMSPSERPKADNRRVLVPYSTAMRELLARGTYNGGRRPSGHDIGETSFNRDNGGAIPPNVIVDANTSSTDAYRKYCRELDVEPHPAPMQTELVSFFVKMCTDPGDLILDPFGGSNMTGAIADQLQRRWAAVEPNESYIIGSKGRFIPDSNNVAVDPRFVQGSLFGA